MVYRCRYCGSYALKPDKNKRDADDADLVYKCAHCGIMCTEQEAEMFDRPAPGSRRQTAARADTVKVTADLDSDYRIPLIPVQAADPGSARAVSLNKSAGSGRADAGPLNESENFINAWTAMQNREWHTALDILNQVQQPLIYPLECLIFSSVCRAAALFQSPQDLLPLRYRQLFILINNIDCIGVYLPNDQDRNFAALQRADAALMLLGSQPVRKHRTTIADQTNYLRANAISAFAEFLKITAQTAPKYRTEYLKMAVRLLLQCLEFSKEYQGLFVTLKEDELNLPTEERLKINADIEQLNADIRMSDPGFVPVQPPPVPKAKVKQTRSLYARYQEVTFILSLILMTALTVGFGILCISADGGDGSLSFIGWFFMIGQLSLFGIPLIYHIYNGTVIKDVDDE